MDLSILLWRSLKTRITLATVTILVISIWLLAFYVSRMLREDMQRLLSDQQFSTAAFMAAELNEELETRLKGLESVAARVSPAMLGDTRQLQKFLEDRSVLRDMFSGGLFAVDAQGKAIADVPLATGRIGVNYADAGHIAAALKQGKSGIGQPVIGKKLGTPIFTIAVPIRASGGQVTGALIGATELSKPNFTDKLTQYRYGKTGGYLLIAPKSRLVITATDKRRIMQQLPPAGVNPRMDRFIDGFQGSDVYVNSAGVEILNSVKSVPVAGWNVAVSLPTEEAFAPIRAMQQRIVLATILLTLLAAMLTWWILRRQLAPMLAAARQLTAMSHATQAPHALPVTREDEIGELIGGVNRLLNTLRQREAALMESEYRWKFALESAGDGVWDVNLGTRQAHYSKRYQEMLGYAEGELKGFHAEWLSHVHEEDRPHVTEAVNAYVEGRSREYAIDYRMRCKDGSYKWIAARGMAVSVGADGKPLRMIGTHSDITERMVQQDLLERQVKERTAQLRAMAIELTTAEERERHLVAQDLHDGLGQLLAMAKLKLSALDFPRADDSQRSKLEHEVKEIEALIDAANLAVRSLSLQLSPPTLHSFGLMPALEWLAHEIQRSYGLRVNVHDDGQPKHLDEAVLKAVFRATRELLVNAAKYAGVEVAEVAVAREDGKLVLSVADAGVGFDPRANEAPSVRGGYGLFSVHERIGYIGGDVQIDSSPGDGTVVVLTVPLTTPCNVMQAEPASSRGPTRAG